MSQETQITLRGYLTAEPKFFQKTLQAIPVTELRVGCTPRRLNRETGEWYDLPTSYYRVRCWRRLAINTASSLKKGDPVLIRGHFYMSNWVDSQQRPRSTLEIDADTIGHDLAYGWAHFLRGTRSAGNSDAVNSGEVARQDTETAEAGNGGDENLPVPGVSAAGEFDEGADSPAEYAQPQPQPQADAVDAVDVVDVVDTAVDADSLEEDVNALEREAVPF